MSQRAAWVLKTAWARASHCGSLEGGLGKLTSAASMALMPQNPWSSLPSERVQFLGM
jgi:hypothetical protein